MWITEVIQLDMSKFFSMVNVRKKKFKNKLKKHILD